MIVLAEKVCERTDPLLWHSHSFDGDARAEVTTVRRTNERRILATTEVY
jgi:hypothetical protein